jgi:ABC-type sugar transport system ATPase subunit
MLRFEDKMRKESQRAGSLALDGLSKAYGGTVVLDGFTHVFEPGRVHALMGKNGSGKSTVVKILSGSVQPSAGTISVDGRGLNFNGPADAMAAGIATVHQELSVIPTLSVGENIYLGRLPGRRRFGLETVDWEALYKGAADLLHSMDLDIDPRQPASALSVGQQQVIEIVKAMSFSPKILLLDEPTSALATKEVEQLFALVRRLRDRGVTMIYITHRMNELFEIADTCAVLRDGRFIGSVEMANATQQKIVEMMFGDVAKAKRPPRRAIDRTVEPVLEVRNMSRGDVFSDVTFAVYPGEILGIAGLLGSGRTEVLRAVFGADRADSGTVVVDGSDLAGATPTTMKAHGLGYTPENRKEFGLVQNLSTHANLCLASLAGIAPRGWITRAMEQPFVRRQINGLGIKAEPMLPVSSLSGGNQQKVVIGNWLNTDPKVMLFDEPSRGVDVHARRQIFEIIWEQARSGLSSIFVSTELEELLEVTDRILVMRHGRIVKEVFPEAISLTELYELCMKDPAQGMAA